MFFIVFTCQIADDIDNIDGSLQQKVVINLLKYGFPEEMILCDGLTNLIRN